MFGKCKVCIAKDYHIASLKEQNAQLLSLLVPKNDPFEVPLVTREADAALSATNELLFVPESQKDEAEELTYDEVISERDRILNGA